jgi:hypothetical protein
MLMHTYAAERVPGLGLLGQVLDAQGFRLLEAEPAPHIPALVVRQLQGEHRWSKRAAA